MLARLNVDMFYLFVAVATFAASPALAQATPEDLIAGYRANSANFGTLRVVWKRVQEEPLAEPDSGTEGASNRSLAERWERAGPGVFYLPREEAGRPGDGEAGRPSFLPANMSRRVILNDYWIDRNRYQVRAPRDGIDANPDTWSFAHEPLTPESLVGTYRDYCVVSFVPSGDRLFRSWDGVDDGGTRHGSLSNSSRHVPEFKLPPLGLPVPSWDDRATFEVSRDGFREAELHRIDRFFLLPPEEMRVVRRDVLDGQSVYVVEHVKLRPFPDDMTDYPGTVETARIERAWIDASRGCIPLRIESLSTLYVDGAPLRPETDEPHTVVEVFEVQSVADGGYYPTRGEVRVYTADPAQGNASGATHTIDDLIAGRVERGPFRCVLWWKESWEATRVEANLPVSESLFAFEFPDNTHYYDSVAKQSGVIGLTDDEVARLAASDGEDSPLERRAAWFVPALTTIAVIGGLLVARIWRRRKRP